MGIHFNYFKETHNDIIFPHNIVVFPRIEIYDTIDILSVVQPQSFYQALRRPVMYSRV